MAECSQISLLNMPRGARTWTPGAEISWSEVWFLPCVYGPSGSEMISLGVRRHFPSLHFKENKTIIFVFHLFGYSIVVVVIFLILLSPILLSLLLQQKATLLSMLM